MSINPNATKEAINNLANLAEQQKTYRAEKIRTKRLKQTHDEQLDEIFKPITETITEFVDCTQKLEEVFQN